MSNSPHYMHLRDGIKMGDGKMQDSMIVDGLWDATTNITWELLQKTLLKNFKLQESSRIHLPPLHQRKATEAITG